MRYGLLRGCYTISGNRLEVLPELLHQRGVNVYRFNAVSKNTCQIIIDYKDYRKFFAICNNMCYNIKKVIYKGLLSPFKNATLILGGVIGVALFIAICVTMQNYIFEIDVLGSGACYKHQTISVANSMGVKKFAKFSSVNLTELEQKILSSNSGLSFVSCKQYGNRLVINTYLSTSKEDPLNSNGKEIISNFNGVIESISVLRGTALKTVGETVSKGEVIVGAYITDKDGETYPSYVIARVAVITSETKTFTVNSVTEDAIKLAVKMAEFDVDGEVVSNKVTINENTINVTLTVRHILNGG